MTAVHVGLIYALFFLSGAAALIYQVVWVRSLSLVFGGSHLAVTTVLAVFMGGLALGSYLFGKRIHQETRLLRLYGLLELGIALCAVIFKAAMAVYPALYIFLSQLAPASLVTLTIIRITFAICVLIIPTTLMGATLPVLSSFISREKEKIGRDLSFLYGINTLGAVAGTIAAGFVLLRYLGLGTTLVIAILLNVLIGVLSLILQNRFSRDLAHSDLPTEPEQFVENSGCAAGHETESLTPYRLVLWGIGVSGFCALGYEILWTRILSMVIGASVYGFSIMLAAFLSGIAAGSTAYGLLLRFLEKQRGGNRTHPLTWSILWFGVIQIIIGVSALLVTIQIRDLPNSPIMETGLSGSRMWASLILAFAYMFGPAFFMGVAFPLAGRVHVGFRKMVGHAVGEVLAYNTVGAILGSAVSGFILIYLIGIERSLQVLTLINIGFGFTVLVSMRSSRIAALVIPVATAAVILYLSLNPAAFRLWDMKKFASMVANQPKAVKNPAHDKETTDNIDILYYAEGAQATVSSVKFKGAYQTFITNGRPEASNSPSDMQCQYTLGHVPMLLNKNPRKVFVLGTGSGMTLGATSVHPSVERIVLAEIEPKVLGVARTFAKYNHHVLDNPKLEIVLNDGRNFLMTTKEKFDVITADPIHPWFSGAGYLYSDEYFKLAAQHLNPGGLITQWLPLYELTDENLKAVVKTFSNNFKYVMVWVTYFDAELVGSNEPITIDEDELERRIQAPEIRKDLERVFMGSAQDFLRYFLMGNAGVSAYIKNGTINTDDNLYLEFSAPFSIGKTALLGSNMAELFRYRETIIPYLKKPENMAALEHQKARWEKTLRAALTVDPVHYQSVAGQSGTPAYDSRLAGLITAFPDDSLVRYLKDDHDRQKSSEPRLMQQLDLTLRDAKGRIVTVRFCAVMNRMSSDYAIVDFVDNTAHKVFGQLRVEGEGKDPYITGKVAEIMSGVQDIYAQALGRGKSTGSMLPSATSVVPEVERLVASMVKNQGSANH